MTFLGTAAAEGIPALWCTCERCEAARRERGKSIRLRSGLLIDGRLLIDCGPDLVAAASFLGLDLSSVRTLLITHGHEDHFLPLNLHIRGQGFCPTPLPEMSIFASPEVIARISGPRFDEAALRIRTHTIAAFDSFLADGYRVDALRASHGTPEMRPLFYAIAKVGSRRRGADQAADQGPRILYAHDTGPFPEDTWAYLENPPDGRPFAFDFVSIDSTYGPIDHTGEGHMSVRQVIEHRDRLAAAGLLKPNARVFANHFSHNGTPAHSELARLLAGSGVEPSFDGLTIDL